MHIVASSVQMQWLMTCMYCGTHYLVAKGTTYLREGLYVSLSSVANYLTLYV